MVYLTSEVDFGRKMQQAQNTEKSTPWYSWIWQRRTKLLGVALVVLLILFIIQWYVIRWFITATVELFEPQFIQRMPEDIQEAEIAQTINQVKVVVKKMPMSLVSGQISWRKVKAAVDYAFQVDGSDPEEIKTLLTMINAAVGFKNYSPFHEEEN